MALNFNKYTVEIGVNSMKRNSSSAFIPHAFMNIFDKWHL